MHSLAPYSVRVFDRNLAGPSDKKYHKLNSIRGNDLLDIIESFANSRTSKYHEIEEENSNKKIKFTHVKKNGRSVYGFIEYGEHGIKGKVVNIENGNVVYKKTKDDSDIKQLYFKFTIPKNETTGICVFHNIHGRGVKGIIDDILNVFFKRYAKDLKIQIRPFSYEKAIRDWLQKAQVKEIRLTQFKPKSAVTDHVDKLSESSATITYKPKKKGGSFGRLFDFQKSKDNDAKNSQALSIMSEYSASVKAVVEFQGKKRIFTLSSNSTPVSSIDFDDDDVEMDDGAPRLSSLNKYSDGLITDMFTTTV